MIKNKKLKAISITENKNYFYKLKTKNWKLETRNINLITKLKTKNGKRKTWK